MLILVAVRQHRRRGRPHKPPAWMARLDHISLWAAAGLAAFLQPWTLVAAGAATDRHGQAEHRGQLPGAGRVRPAGHVQLPGHGAVRGVRARCRHARLRQLRSWLDTHTDQMIVGICLLLGFWLAGKSIYLLVELADAAL